MIKKKSLLNRLVSSSTTVIVFLLVFSGLASYLTVKRKTTDNINNSLCSALSISSKAQSAFNEELNQVSKTIESFNSIKESAGNE